MRWKLPYLDPSASRWSDFFGSSTGHTNMWIYGKMIS